MNIPAGDIVEPENERAADDPGGTGLSWSGFEETIKIGTTRANLVYLEALNLRRIRVWVDFSGAF
jgi:hypothetical protein